MQFGVLLRWKRMKLRELQVQVKRPSLMNILRRRNKIHDWEIYFTFFVWFFFTLCICLLSSLCLCLSMCVRVPASSDSLLCALVFYFSLGMSLSLCVWSYTQSDFLPILCTFDYQLDMLRSFYFTVSFQICFSVWLYWSIFGNHWLPILLQK